VKLTLITKMIKTKFPSSDSEDLKVDIKYDKGKLVITSTPDVIEGTEKLLDKSWETMIDTKV